MSDLHTNELSCESSNPTGNGDFDPMIFASGEVIDQRRKLNSQDYSRIQFQYTQGYTIRMIANEHGVSTKFIHKLLTNDTEQPQELGPSFLAHSCSGCSRSFDYSGLLTHFELWTSGGLHGLWCGNFMPGTIFNGT